MKTCGTRSRSVATAILSLVTLVLIAPLAAAQVVVPLIPTDPSPPSGNECVSEELNNSNFDRFDPCCYPANSPLRPTFCPTKVSDPFNVAESFVRNQLLNVFNALNFPQLLGFLPGDPSGFIAGQLADFVVERGTDWLFRRANGSQGSAPLSLTVPEVFLRVTGDEYLSSAIFTSIASISRNPNFSVVEGTAYKIPYPAGPSVLVACQNSGGEHRDRDFNRSVMTNGTIVNGNSTFITQAGVPTEIAANRPSWSSRQIWDYYWTWWFGDASMVPFSEEEDAHTVHTYNHVGQYTLAFVMMQDDPYFSIGVSGNFLGGLDYRAGIDHSSDYLFPDACNYATMDVQPNQAPYAQFSAGPTNLPFQYRFTAYPSWDPDGNPLSYLWRMQDGATTRARTFYKTYPSNTQFPVMETVELTVSDGAKMHTITRDVFVYPSTCPADGPFPPISGGICET